MCSASCDGNRCFCRFNRRWYQGIKTSDPGKKHPPGAENYDPSLIAKYAINLAQAFNKYYAHTRILDESPERESRLALSYSTAVVLKEALRLLGVDAPEKM